MKKRLLSVFILLVISFASLHAETIDTIQVYTNRLIIGRKTVQSRDTLLVRNVTVAPTGQLTLTAPTWVKLDESFEVKLGGTLEVYGGTPFSIAYTYDASGNRILKSKTQ